MSKSVQLISVTIIIIVVFSYTVSQPDYSAEDYMLIGGVLGAVSSVSYNFEVISFISHHIATCIIRRDSYFFTYSFLLPNRF